MTDIFTNATDAMHDKRIRRDIWADSRWRNISNLENDDVGKVGENVINDICKVAKIDVNIDGLKTKQIGGGIGDGMINNKSVEIKTARLGSTTPSFQHELGEKPWNAEYMLFLDVAPNELFITVFKNFNQEFYESSGRDSKIKCEPYFPTKSITWRKCKGAFKLDTTPIINRASKYCFTIDGPITDDIAEKFKEFITTIVI